MKCRYDIILKILCVQDREGYQVYSFLITLMIILSLLIIVAVMMQPSKQNSAASAFTGGADQLFGKQKARGFEAVMQRITTVLAIAWVVVAILLAYLPLA